MSHISGHDAKHLMDIASPKKNLIRCFTFRVRVHFIVHSITFHGNLPHFLWPLVSRFMVICYFVAHCITFHSHLPMVYGPLHDILWPFASFYGPLHHISWSFAPCFMVHLFHFMVICPTFYGPLHHIS